MLNGKFEMIILILYFFGELESNEKDSILKFQILDYKNNSEANIFL